MMNYLEHSRRHSESAVQQRKATDTVPPHHMQNSSSDAAQNTGHTVSTRARPKNKQNQPALSATGAAAQNTVLEAAACGT